MSIRLPNITMGTTESQVAQIRSYLYQLVPELIMMIENAGGAPAPVEQKKESDPIYAMPSGTAAQSTFNALKPYIIQSTDIFTSYYEKTIEKLSEYKDEVGTKDGWSYEISTDGRCSIHGVIGMTLESDSTQDGSLWKSEPLTVEFPFPLENPTISCTAENALSFLESIEDGEAVIRLIFSEKATAGESFNLHIQIKATKKEEA